MIFGKGERRRTICTSSENLTKSAKISAFWRVQTQSPVATREEVLKTKIPSERKEEPKNMNAMRTENNGILSENIFTGLSVAKRTTVFVGSDRNIIGNLKLNVNSNSSKSDKNSILCSNRDKIRIALCENAAKAKKKICKKKKGKSFINLRKKKGLPTAFCTAENTFDILRGFFAHLKKRVVVILLEVARGSYVFGRPIKS